MVDAGSFEVTRDRSVIQEYVRSAIQHKKELSRYAFPFVYCGGNGCRYTECFECVKDSSKDEMLCCTKCKSIRCSLCSNAMLQGLDSGDARDELFSRIAAGEAGVAEYGDYLLRSIPRVMLSCESCREPLCFRCMSESELRSASLSDIYHFPGENGNKSEMPYKCSRCYWASKPCTNPNCPNEVGIPTKRCGGCHIDRYCSVECQAAAYPDHAARCMQIQEKRLLAGEKDDREDTSSTSIFAAEGTGADEDSSSSEGGESDVSNEISNSEEEETPPDDESDGSDSYVHKDLFEEFARDYGYLYGCVSM